MRDVCLAFFILYVAALVARRWNKLERITLVQYAGQKLHLAALTEKLAARKWYELVFLDEDIDHASARDYATQRGGQLVSFETELELDTVTCALTPSLSTYA